MLQKINIQPLLDEYWAYAKGYLLALRDVRNVGLLVFVVIVLLISWSGVKTIQVNYGLQKQISQLRQENAVQQLKNTNVRLQNEYYGTDQYLEVTARQNFGLAAPGETELLVPKSVALAHTVPMPKDNATTMAKVPIQAFWQRNFQSWMDFFLGRGPQK